MLFKPKYLIRSSGFIISAVVLFVFLFFFSQKTKSNNNQSASSDLIFELEKIQSGSSFPFIHLSKEETCLQVNFSNKKRRLPFLMFTYAARLITSKNNLQNLIVKTENNLIKKYSPPFNIIYHRLNI